MGDVVELIKHFLHLSINCKMAKIFWDRIYVDNQYFAYLKNKWM